jgi:hypothetical protein
MDDGIFVLGIELVFEIDTIINWAIQWFLFWIGQFIW